MAGTCSRRPTPSRLPGIGDLLFCFCFLDTCIRVKRQDEDGGRGRWAGRLSQAVAGWEARPAAGKGINLPVALKPVRL